MKKLRVLSVLLVVLQVFGIANSYASSRLTIAKLKILRLSSSSIPKFYGSYEEALAECQKGGYQNCDLVQVVTQKNAKFRENINSESVIDISHLRSILGIAMAVRNNELNVVDFGGGGGNHYTVAKCVLNSSIKLNWNVIETEAMVNAAKFLENNELSFFSNIQGALNKTGQVDLVFSSGALHCCDDPLVVLQNLVSVKARYLYITRTCFNKGGEKFISIQHSSLSENGPGMLPSGFTDKAICYPNVFIPIDQVESVLQSEYEIRFKILEDKEVLGLVKLE